LKTLITAARTAAAYRIKSIIKTDVVLGDFADLPQTMIKAGSMIKTPNPADAAFAHQMLTLCLDNQIEAIAPLRIEEIKLLAEAKQLFNEFGIILYINTNEKVTINTTLGYEHIAIIDQNNIVWSTMDITPQLPLDIESGIFTITHHTIFQVFTAD
jgi:hypothetical protein